MQKAIFSILSLALVGCATGLPTPPVRQVRILDVTNQVCGIWNVTPTTGKPKYVWVRDISIRECDGSVCVSPVDHKKLENWAINAQNDYTCKLKE